MAAVMDRGWKTAAEVGGTLRLDERGVLQLQIDFRLGLLIDGGYDLVIETPFFYFGAGDAERRIDPATPEVALALPLLRKVLASAVIKTGTLQLVMTTGETVLVPPDPNYEAWSISAKDGERIIALPGGGFSHWAPSN